MGASEAPSNPAAYQWIKQPNKMLCREQACLPNRRKDIGIKQMSSNGNDSPWQAKSAQAAHETSAYQSENQTQCHRTLIQHHAILHQKDAGVQYSFQLCQQRKLLYYLCTCDLLARNVGRHASLLAWMPCCFPCSMDLLVFHACFNQKPFQKLENH